VCNTYLYSPVCCRKYIDHVVVVVVVVIMGKKDYERKEGGKKRGRQLADDTWAGVINTPERVNHHPAPATGVGLYVARVIISALKRWMRRRGTYEEEEESLG
jgi:hypothetical protein